MRRRARPRWRRSQRAGGESRDWRARDFWLLLQRGLHRAEGPLQVCADALHDGDDRNRDAGGDETIFNRGRARLVSKKADEFRHLRSSLTLVRSLVMMAAGMAPAPAHSIPIGREEDVSRKSKIFLENELTAAYISRNGAGPKGDPLGSSD